jgi:small subunit ribosomal protein S1
MSWTKRIKHPSEVLRKGDVVRARITNIDVGGQRVSLSIKEFLPNEWQSFKSEHGVGDEIVGRVVNVTDFGLFVDVFQGLEGLAHVSEVDVPGGKLEDYFSVGDWVRARILRIEDDEKKVGLTMRGVSQPEGDELSELESQQDEASVASAREAAAGAIVQRAEERQVTISDADGDSDDESVAEVAAEAEDSGSESVADADPAESP